MTTSCEAVESSIARSPPLQAQVAALRASCLPYRAAFEQQALPPLPERLQQRVAALVSVAGAASAREPRSQQRRLWLGVGACSALAASFSLGSWVARRPGAPGEPVGWVEAIASYQALYVRETVDQTPDSPQRLRLLLAGFDERQKAALFVPDLRAAGLQFRRVQRLGYGGLPLVQMVFLPASGAPVALCVLPVGHPDAPVQLQRLHGLQVASWQRQGLAFVLACDLPIQRVGDLAQQLSKGRFSPA